MKLKRFSKKQVVVFYKNQAVGPSFSNEPHQVVKCVACDDAKSLEFHRSGDDEMYYVCGKCGFESEPIGKAPHWLK